MSSLNRIIGLTKEYFLKFTLEEMGLKLDLCLKINQIEQAKAVLSKKNFQLDIGYRDGETKVKIVLGGK
jgi:hypothetical protein